MFKEDNNLESLTTRFYDLKQPTLSSEKKALMKQRILAQINVPKDEKMPIGFALLVQKLKSLASEIELTIHDKVQLKERVMDAIELRSQKSFFWSNLFVFNKKFVSAVTVLVLVLGMFAFVNVDTKMVWASGFTMLQDYDGEVLIQREGETVSAVKGMELYERDRIITRDGGLAVIKYFDDSVSRLSENSELIISRLYKPQQSYVRSYVEVSLLTGKLWARVINLVDEDSAFSVKAKDIYANAQKAAFNVEMQNDGVEVEVFNRSVDVFKEKEKVASVVTGEKAVVKNESVKVAKLAEKEKKEKWVSANLVDDKAYIAAVNDEIIEKKLQAVGAENVNSAGDVEPTLREKAALFLSFNDADKKKMEFDLAEKNFIAAQVKLSAPEISPEEKTKAENDLKLFEEAAKNFYAFIDKVAYTDEKYAQELRGYIQEKTLVHKKDLSLVLADSPLYEAKKIVENVEILSADNEEEKKTMEQNNVIDKLAEVEDVVILSEGQTLPQAAFDEYKETVNQATQIVQDIKDAGQIEEKKDVLNQVSNYVEILSDVSPEINDPVGQVLDEDVANGGAEESTVYGNVKVWGDKLLPPGL